MIGGIKGEKEGSMCCKAIMLAFLTLSANFAISVDCFALQKGNLYKELAIFSDVLDCVRSQYVTVPDDKKMIEGAINGMLTSLDPHSSYLNADESKQLDNITSGEFAGIGIVVASDQKFVKVVSPMLDTPAAKAGILAGDLISKVDGKDVYDNKLDANVKRMRGKIGTTVHLTIIRKGVAKPLEIAVKRDVIKIKDIIYRINNNVGYIRLLEFTGHTFDDLSKAIADIQSKIPEDKIKGYILDMRLNPGGLLNQAVKVSDAFLNSGIIVSTKGRNKKSDMLFSASKGDLIKGKPLLVMINGGTASAAEIVAGALQDNGRAKILGTRSFGKGSVQSVIPLSNGGALRLTTALYYTPKGQSIQGHGIDPDYKVLQPLPDKYKGLNVNIGESSLKGHIKGNIEDSAGSGSSAYVPSDPKDDAQLIAAYKKIDEWNRTDQKVLSSKDSLNFFRNKLAKLTALLHKV